MTSTNPEGNRVYEEWLRNNDSDFRLFDKTLIATAARHRDDTVFQYTVGQFLASRGNYEAGAKTHVIYMNDNRYDGAVAEREAMEEDIKLTLGITVDLQELINDNPEQAAAYVARMWKLEDSVPNGC